MSRPMTSTRNAYFPGMLGILGVAAYRVSLNNRKMMARVGWELDDLVQMAWLRTGKYCLSKEDMSKYLFLNAKREMHIMLNREYNRLSRCDYVSLNSLLSEEDHSLDNIDALAVVYDDHILTDIKTLRCLTVIQKKIIFLYFWGGQTLKEIGINLNYSKERISRLKLEALDKLEHQYFRKVSYD